MAESKRTNEADFLGAGWGFPMEVEGGRLNVVSGNADIRQSVLLILQTIKGQRVMRPEFGSGVNDLVFAPNNPGTLNLAAFYVRDALALEPRIELEDVDVQVNPEEPNRLDIYIEYRVLSTNSSENLVYPFYLQ